MTRDIHNEQMNDDFFVAIDKEVGGNYSICVHRDGMIVEHTAETPSRKEAFQIKEQVKERWFRRYLSLLEKGKS